MPDWIFRPARLPDAAGMAAVHAGRAERDEFEGGRFGDEFDPEWYSRRLGEPGQDPALWQVAWSGKQVTGQVLSIIEKGRAEVFEVSVHPAWRRKGLARALLTRALLGLRQRNVPVIRLHTVAEFKIRARDLYQSVGFRVIKEFPRYRKPVLRSCS